MISVISKLALSLVIIFVMIIIRDDDVMTSRMITISKHVIPKEGGFEPQIDGVILPPSQPAPLDPRQNEVIVAFVSSSAPSSTSLTLTYTTILLQRSIMVHNLILPRWSL